MMNMVKADLRAKAEKIIDSLRADAELISPRIRDWWLEYLQSEKDRYLDTFSFLHESDLGCRILEIGSVPGHFTLLLKQLGYKIEGVDIDPVRAEKIWNEYGISVKKVDIEREPLPFDPDSFDVCFFTEILEHLRLNPLFSLREAWRILKPSGRLILSTPNITLLHRIRFILGLDYQMSPVEEFQKLEWLGHMGHIRLYSLKEVKEFLKHTGFHILSSTYKGTLPSSWKIQLFKLFWLKKNSFCPFLYVVAKKNL